MRDGGRSTPLRPRGWAIAVLLSTALLGPAPATALADPHASAEAAYAEEASAR
jgi:hypothetical protein